MLWSVNDGRGLTINLLKTTIVAPPSNASKWQMVFNSAFKGLSKPISDLTSKTRNYKRKAKSSSFNVGDIVYL